MSEQGRTYAEFIFKEVEAEEQRRERSELQASRITGSGGALILVVVSLAILRFGKDSPLPSPTVFLTVSSLTMLLLSVGMAVAGTLSVRYRVPTVRTMESMLDEHWGDTEVSARNICSTLYLRRISSLRVGNRRKSLWLLAAVYLQGISICLLVGSTLSILA